MHSKTNRTASYHLRTPDGTVYGPVDIVALCIWATDARVIPGGELSDCEGIWFPVETIPELRLNWSVEFSDGTIYGPLNLLAIRVLASENSIPMGARLSEKGSGRKAVLDDSIMPLLVAEFHQMLAGCGTLMSAAIESLREAHQVALAEAGKREALLATVQAKLDKTELDLASSVKLAAEFGAKCVGVERALNLEQEQAVKASDKLAQLISEHEDIRRQWVAAQAALRNKEVLIQDMESAVTLVKAQSEKHVAEIQAKVVILEQDLNEVRQRADTLAGQLVQAQEHVKQVQSEGKAALQALQESLQREIQTALKQRDEIRENLDTVKGRYEALRQESARTEQLSSAKLRQIEKEIKDSTELVAKTQLEMERREIQFRDLQRKMDEQKGGFTPRDKVFESEVIHAEVIHSETVETEVADREPVSPPRKESSRKPGILNSVEARLQIELRQWEALNREQGNKNRTGSKWFGRK